MTMPRTMPGRDIFSGGPACHIYHKGAWKGRSFPSGISPWHAPCLTFLYKPKSFFCYVIPWQNKYFSIWFVCGTTTFSHTFSLCINKKISGKNRWAFFCIGISAENMQKLNRQACVRKTHVSSLSHETRLCRKFWGTRQKQRWPLWRASDMGHDDNFLEALLLELPTTRPHGHDISADIVPMWLGGWKPQHLPMALVECSCYRDTWIIDKIYMKWLEWLASGFVVALGRKHFGTWACAYMSQHACITIQVVCWCRACL